MSLKKISLLLLILVSLATACGCGGGGTSSSTASDVSRALNSPPTVTNVRVSGGSEDVVVTYDVSDPENDTCSVVVQYSLDGGAHFTLASNVEGQTAEVGAGRDRTLKWKVLSTVPRGGSGIVVRVAAVSGGAAVSTADSRQFTTNPPPPAGSSYFRVAFISDRDIWKKIWIMNSDGSGKQKLFPTNHNEFFATFSASGALAFVSDVTGSSEIYISDSGGASARRLTYMKDIVLPFGGYSHPSMSADGRRVAFIKNYGNYRVEVAVMESDGSGYKKLYDTNVFAQPVAISPDGSKVAFSAYGDEYWDRAGDIFVVPASGGSPVRLTDAGRNGVYYHSPCFSPDGSKIAFVSDVEGNPEIYVMNSDGTGRTRLTNNGSDDSAPSFSPDGKTIIFSSGGSSSSAICSVPLAGGPVAKLTEGSFRDQSPATVSGFAVMSASTRALTGINVSNVRLSGLSLDLAAVSCRAYYSDGSESAVVPAWAIVSGGGSISNNVYLASVSTKVAVLRATYTESGITVTRDVTLSPSSEGRIYYASSGAIYSMRPDGTGTTLVTSFSALEVKTLSFSPDGRTLVFSATSGGKDEDLYLMDARTFARRRLTSNAGNNSDPNFSADGSKLVFTSDRDRIPDRDRNREIYCLDIASGNAVRLTYNSNYDDYACFSPDGTKVVCQSNRSGRSDPSIVVMDSDGGNQKELTGVSDGYNGHPRFLNDGRIVFESNRGDGKYKIYAMNSDGTGAAPFLKDHQNEQGWPEVSRRTGDVLFNSYIGASWRTYCARSDGTGAAEVADTQGSDASYFDFDGKYVVHIYRGKAYASEIGGSKLFKYMDFSAAKDMTPSLSPGGDRLLYASNSLSVKQYVGAEYPEAATAPDICVMAPDGTAARRITCPSYPDHFLAPSPGNFYPAFSPDASRITYTSERSGKRAVYISDSDGRNEKLVSGGSWNDHYSSFSADGTKIAFMSDRDGNLEIYTAGIDGTGLKNLTSNSSADYDPRFSPDGTKICFVSERYATNPELCVMNADGTGLLRLTNNSAYEGYPAFSPDGTKIVFYSEESGAGLYVVNIDGTGMQRIVYGEYYSPFWWGK